MACSNRLPGHCIEAVSRVRVSLVVPGMAMTTWASRPMVESAWAVRARVRAPTDLARRCISRAQAVSPEPDNDHQQIPRADAGRGGLAHEVDGVAQVHEAHQKAPEDEAGAAAGAAEDTGCGFHFPDQGLGQVRGDLGQNAAQFLVHLVQGHGKLHGFRRLR